MARPMSEWITLRLKDVDQIDDSIETIQRIIDGEPLRPIDAPRLSGSWEDAND